jgi:hypothetical protein
VSQTEPSRKRQPLAVHLDSFLRTICVVAINPQVDRWIDPSHEPSLNQYFMHYGFQLEVYFYLITFSVTERNIKAL